MKKLFVVLVCLAFLGGCATFGWKPSEDQLAQYESNLQTANLVEMSLFVIFDSLCADKVLNENQCIAGYAADTEWDAAYALAMGAIADYRAGVTDEAMMRKYVTAATAAGVRIVALIKSILTDKPKTAAVSKKGREKASKPPAPARK